MKKNKIEEIILSEFKNKDVGIGLLYCISEDEQVKNLVDKLHEAINYIGSCKSDSELLASKEKQKNIIIKMMRKDEESGMYSDNES